MRTTKKQFRNEPCQSEPRKRKSRLGNVISLRINDQEKIMLEKLTTNTSGRISDIMREAIHLWSSRRRNACMD